MQQPTHRLRRSAAILVVAVVMPVLAGCASGFNAAVLQPYTPGEGVYDDSGTVAAFNMVVVTDEQGNGTLVATMLNSGEAPDSLVGVSAQAAEGPPLESNLSADVELPPNQLVQLQEQNAVSFSGEGLRAGYFIQLSLELADGETITQRVPVEPQSGPYAEIDIPS